MTKTGLIVVAALLAGLTVGLGGYTFVYAKGYSYLTNDPAACANCHVMRDHFNAWTRASHRSVAVCNDCHTPPGVVPKYLTKAQNGFWHSFYFTTGRYPDPLQITPRNHEVTELACRNCHGEIADIKAASGAGASDADVALARSHQRRGQFLLDFIEAENSMGFHADQESVRVLALSLDETRRGQAALSGGRATPGSRTVTRPTP